MPESNYIELTMTEIADLPRDKTVFFSAISPIEAHGPHLPVGTDLFIAETLRDRVKAELLQRRPHLHAVTLPTMPLGSMAIPPAGSFALRASAIESSLLDWGNSLRKLGFKFWLLADNHGGPSHQLAIAVAAHKLQRKGFFLIAPFNYVFRHMLGKTPELLHATGLAPDRCGGMDDSHAGTNETSLMRAAHADKVRDTWQTTPRAKEPPFKMPHKLIHKIGDLCGALGLKDEALDFHFFAHGLAWIQDPDMDAWSGDPSLSDPAAGEAMLKFRTDAGLMLMEKAIDGDPVKIKPMGWAIRALRNVMG
jgi:creatinine amidohydrolase/Fe(II)-dependent formamide hydrolase-like protein